MDRFECAVILTVLNNYIYFGIVAKPRSSLSVSKNNNIIIEMFKVKNSKFKEVYNQEVKKKKIKKGKIRIKILKSS